MLVPSSLSCGFLCFCFKIPHHQVPNCKQNSSICFRSRFWFVRESGAKSTNGYSCANNASTESYVKFWKSRLYDLRLENPRPTAPKLARKARFSLAIWSVFLWVLGNKCRWSEVKEQGILLGRADNAWKGLRKGVWRLGTEGRRREAESQILALHWGREVGCSGWTEILRKGELTDWKQINQSFNQSKKMNTCPIPNNTFFLN